MGLYGEGLLRLRKFITKKCEKVGNSMKILFVTERLTVDSLTKNAYGDCFNLLGLP